VNQQSLAAIVSSGDLLKSLQAVRDAIAADLDAPGGQMRDRAALYRRLVDVLARVESITSTRSSRAGCWFAEYFSRRPRRVTLCGCAVSMF
jgi:hypothetical protein